MSDDLYRLGQNIKALIRESFKRNGFKKTTKIFNILGCSFNELKIYLESQFEPWMNWSNYGNQNGYPKNINIAWDIDHKIPLSTAKTEDDLIKLNHYSNLQPLCAYTNRFIKRNNLSDNYEKQYKRRTRI